MAIFTALWCIIGLNTIDIDIKNKIIIIITSVINR